MPAPSRPKDDAKLKVLLDANILIANFRPGRALKLLIDAARTGQLELIVPEIALREASNKFEERCAAERRALDKALAGLERIGVYVGPQDPIDPRAQRVRYEQELRRTLRAAKGRVPRLPDVAHTELVDWALQRRKPFKENGAGYRDALLWANVLEESAAGPILLFTRDSSDFAVDGQLAPDLARDVERASGDSGSVQLRTDLAGFVDEFVNVSTVAVEAVRRALPRAYLRLVPFIERVLLDVDLDRDGLRRVAGDASDLAPDGMVGERLAIGDAQVVEVTWVSAASVERAELISTGDVLAELYFGADVDLDLEVDIVGHDARTGRPRVASCFASARATLAVDLDATFYEDDLDLADVGFSGATVLDASTRNALPSWIAAATQHP